MKEGDIVRFARWEEIPVSMGTKNWHKVPKKNIGILIKHDKLMGTAHVLHEGELIKVRSVFVQKAGRKDVQK